METKLIELNKNINIYNKYNRMENALLVEFYINNSELYELCNSKSIDNRCFGFFYHINEITKYKELFLIRELNNDYFLLSRLIKNVDEEISEGTIEILPIKNNNEIILWTITERCFSPIAKIELSDKNILHIIDKKFFYKNHKKRLSLLIDDGTLNIKYEKLLYFNKQNTELNQYFSIFRTPIKFKLDRNITNKTKVNNTKKDIIKYCILNSYDNDNEYHLPENIRNILNINKNIQIDIINPTNLNIPLSRYIENYDNIIYFGHGHSNKHMQLVLEDVYDLLYEGDKLAHKDNFIFLACNENKYNSKAEYNSIISLLNVGFKKILLTDSKVKLNELATIIPYLIKLITFNYSIDESIKILNRLGRSVIPLQIPFRLYKNIDDLNEYESR